MTIQWATSLEGKNKVTTSHLGSYCQHFLIRMVSLVTSKLTRKGIIFELSIKLSDDFIECFILWFVYDTPVQHLRYCVYVSYLICH